MNPHHDEIYPRVASPGQAEECQRKEEQCEQVEQHRKEDSNRFMVFIQILSVQPCGMVAQPK